MPSCVVGGPLEQHGADALRDAAADLALDDRGVDERAAVLGRDVPLDLHDAGLDVDLDDGAVAAAGPAAFAAVERGLDLEVGVDVGIELPRRGLPGDLRHRDRAVGVAAHQDLAVGDLEVLGAGLDEERREIEHLALELPGAVQRHAAGHGGRPAAARETERHHVAVPDDDPDLLEWHAELVGGDLGEGGLVALPVRHLAGEQRHDAVFREREPHELQAHRPAARFGGARAGSGLDEGRQADAQVTTPHAFLRPAGAGRPECPPSGRRAPATPWW